LHYQYDSAGNITVITYNLPGGSAGSAFEYDDLNRLMTASGTSGTKLEVLTR
jgi:hypothetical protein